MLYFCLLKSMNHQQHFSDPVLISLASHLAWSLSSIPGFSYQTHPSFLFSSLSFLYYSLFVAHHKSVLPFILLPNPARPCPFSRASEDNFSFPLRAFIFLLILSTHFCMFSTFSTNVFTRLIAVILTSLSNNFYMYIMSEFLTCILCLSYIVMKIDLSLHTIIFLRFGMPCNFLL